MDLKLETPAETRARCAEHNAEWLGDRIEFRPRGIDAPRALAKRIFEEHSFGDYVEAAPRPDSVLKAAAREGSNPTGYMTRKFVSPNKDTAVAIHVTLVTGRDESGDEYRCLARVRVGQLEDPATGLTQPAAIARPPEGATEYSDPAARDRAVWIAERANHVLHNVGNAHVSDAIRKALLSVGAVQSLGGGNNFYVPVGVAERVHAFMSEISTRLGLYYVRDPKTTLGAHHEREVIAEAAERSLTDDLDNMRKELELALEKSQNPTLTADGKPKKRHASLKHQIHKLQVMSTKMGLYRDIVERDILAPMAELRGTIEEHFKTILTADGGSLDWVGSDAAEASGEASGEAQGSDVGDASEASEAQSDSAPQAKVAPRTKDGPFDWME